MSRFHSYINSAIKIIEAYNGEKPFAAFLKQFFTANKKYGSKDRRQVADLCYNYFRIGFAGAALPPDQRLLLATFLCETSPSGLLENLKPEWNRIVSLPINEKCRSLQPEFLPEEIFPFCNELSDGIEAAEYCMSFLVQPDLFIRIRPQSKETVIRKLKRSTLSYKLEDEDCVRMAVSEKLDELLLLDKEVVVQDYNSQKVLDYLKKGVFEIGLIKDKPTLDLSVWDCCAASGGKSILLYDIFKRKFNLTVSDNRPGIVLNLHQRFKKAGIKEYKYFIADLSSEELKQDTVDYNLIICDAPCSGSGTWSRTPEQLFFFEMPSIKKYSNLQKRIIARVIPHLLPGGLFIYITCSVFKEENELIAAFIAENFNCKLLHQQLLKGYNRKADNMFVAVFSKK